MTRQPLEQFTAEMKEMIATMKAVPLEPEATRISFAGERSQAELQRRRVSGILLAISTFASLNELAEAAQLEKI